jgi:ribosomal-protein-alanine N-acetyltransferase
MAFCKKYYVDWLNTSEVTKYLETAPVSTINLLAKYIQNTVDNNILMWAITIKETGRHIGNIKIDPVNLKHGVAEYGIMIGDIQSWGKGYAKEASSKVIDECFNNLGIRKVCLGYVASNQAAKQLYSSLGFIQEGCFKEHHLKNGVYEDSIRMGLIKPKK